VHKDAISKLCFETLQWFQLLTHYFHLIQSFVVRNCFLVNVDVHNKLKGLYIRAVVGYKTQGMFEWFHFVYNILLIYFQNIAKIEIIYVRNFEEKRMYHKRKRYCLSGNYFLLSAPCVLWALLIKFWYDVVCKKCVWKEKSRILLNTSSFLLSPTKTNFKVLYLRFWILLLVDNNFIVFIQPVLILHFSYFFDTGISEKTLALFCFDPSANIRGAG
jgi:hypothetical protein